MFLKDGPYRMLRETIWSKSRHGDGTHYVGRSTTLKNEKIAISRMHQEFQGQGLMDYQPIT